MLKSSPPHWPTDLNSSNRKQQMSPTMKYTLYGWIFVLVVVKRNDTLITVISHQFRLNFTQIQLNFLNISFKSNHNKSAWEMLISKCLSQASFFIQIYKQSWIVRVLCRINFFLNLLMNFDWPVQSIAVNRMFERVHSKIKI